MEDLSFSCIFVLYYLILSVDILILDTFGVYRVHSKTHMLVLSVGFCRRVADWSIYETFMLTSDVNVFRFPTWRLVNNHQKIGSKCGDLILIRLEVRVKGNYYVKPDGRF